MENLKKQMSETMLMGVLLSLTGGFLDAYTYICRGHVFANAQTGNVVLFGINLAQRNWKIAFGYLIPIFAFVAGVFVAELIKRKHKNSEWIHWRQIVIALEAVALVAVAFMPQNMNVPANILVSFVCALQSETFRKIRGNICSTTMCTGNLRTGTELFCLYLQNGDKTLKRRSMEFYLINIVFIAGAVIGTVLSLAFADFSVLFGFVILSVAFVVMFIDDERTSKCR